MVMPMSRLKSTVLGVLSLVPMAAAVFVAIWPGWREGRWAAEFEREYGYDPFDPSLNWRDVPVVEETGLFLEVTFVAVGVGLVGFVCAVVLVICFSRAASRSETVDTRDEKVWLMALIIGNALVFPVAWYVFVWKKRGGGDLSAPD